MAFTRRNIIGSAVVGALFAFAVVVGGELYRTNALAGLAADPGTVIANLGLALVSGVGAAAVALALLALQRKLDAPSLRKTPAWLSTARAGVAVAVALFCCWMPCMLAYWPGMLTYDIGSQTHYILSGSWTTQQPPLHTLIWMAFMQLEGFGGLHAITWYDLAQMAFLAASFSCALLFLARRGVHPVLWAVAFAFFALNPVVALFAITPAKDAPLAGFLALAIVGIARLVADPEAFARSKPRCAGLVACIVACCLLRSNMLVAVAIFAVVAVVVMKEARKTVAVLFAVPLAIVLVVVGPVYSAAHITPGSSAIASVPFQQVTNIMSKHKDELSDEELDVIDQVIPVDKSIERYNPRFADRVTRLFKGREVGVAAMKDKIIDLAVLWVQLDARYFGDALDAFLALNVPYWYPFSSTPDPYSGRIYIETDPWKTSGEYAVDPDSKLPGLREAYESVADYSALDNPVAGIVFSPSSAVWAIALALLLLYNSGSRRRALVCMLPALFWLSFLIGPVSNMRYMFPLFCLYPLLACAALQPTRVMAPEPRPEPRG